MRIQGSSGIQASNEIDDELKPKNDRFQRLMKGLMAAKEEAAEETPAGGEVVGTALRAAVEAQGGQLAAEHALRPSADLAPQSARNLNQELQRLQEECTEPQAKAVHAVADQKEELIRQSIHTVA